MVLCCKLAGKTWALIFGFVFLLLSLLIGIIWPSFFTSLVYQQLTLQNGTQNFKYWLRTPFPMYLKIYMFNMTNSKDWASDPKNVKPKFEEIGPYVFQEIRERKDISSNENTIIFNQTRTWVFCPELSSNLSISEDYITNINPVSATLNYNLRFLPSWEKMIVHALLDKMGSLLVTKSVKQLLFDGYEDNQLNYLNKVKQIIPGMPIIPYTKFGWFVNRNGSANYDGRLEILNGKNDVYKLGLMTSWNGLKQTKYFKGKCGHVSGTTGEVWPPMKRTDIPITMFITDICRHITLQPEKNETKLSIRGVKWSGNQKTLDGMDDESSETCWCIANKCPDMKPGIFNMSSCQYGAPAFISYPHFYLAHSSYLEQLEGLHPNESKHQFYVVLNPDYGIPLEIRARFQINMLITNEHESKLYKDISNIFIPMIWFTQSADISDTLAESVVNLGSIRKYGIWICYSLAALAVPILIIVAITSWRANNDVEDDLNPILHNAEDESTHVSNEN